MNILNRHYGDLEDVEGFRGRIDITNAVVYGMGFAEMASGYPMRTDLPDDEGLIVLGKDLGRAEKLSNAPIGSGHDNFLNGIILQFDLTAPIKMWTELQRYHFIDFVSSQSTMHRLQEMNFDVVFDESVPIVIKDAMKALQNTYKADPTKANWLRFIMSCPVGLKLTARMTTNYRQLKTIYAQRKNHRLPHWKEFCEWIKTLPGSKYIIQEGE